MIAEYNRLDQEKSSDYGKKVELIQFDSKNKRDCHQTVPEKNGPQNQKQSHVPGFVDLPRNGFPD